MEKLSDEDRKLLDEVETSCRQLESKSYTASLMQDILVFTDEFVRAADEDVYSDDARMFNTLEDTQKREQLKTFLGFDETPSDPKAVLNSFQEMFHKNYGPICLTNGSMLGYNGGSGNTLSAIGTFLMALTNHHIFHTDAGNYIEEQMLRWTSDLIGYPEQSRGVFTTGSSMASVLAFVVARDEKIPSSANFHKAVMYMSTLAHNCFEKALNVVGLRGCLIRHVPVSSCHKMDVSLLETFIMEDKENGLLPFVVVGTLGVFATGTIDPLDEIADLAKRHGLWFHVDAAYGGSFLVLDNVRVKSKGVEYCDSINIDFHKAMNQSFGIGCLIVREGSKLRSAMSTTSPFLKDEHVTSVHYRAPDYTFELTRSVRAIPMWWSFKILGTTFFQSLHTEKLLLSQYLHSRLSAMTDIVVGPPPTLSVVLFWYCPRDMSITNGSKQLYDEMKKDPRTYIYPVFIGDMYTLRVCVTSLRTHIQHIETCIDVIQTSVQRLSDRCR